MGVFHIRHQNLQNDEVYRGQHGFRFEPGLNPCKQPPGKKKHTKLIWPAEASSLKSEESHRGLLTLDAAAVEAQRRHAVGVALDVEDALVVLLARLRLRQVASSQRDWPNHPGRDQDVGGGDDLRAALQGETARE